MNHMFEFSPWQALLLLSSWVLIWGVFRFGSQLSTRERLAAYGIAAVLSCLNLWSYSLFGKMVDYGPPQGPQPFHFHEQFHYYMVPKYYPELGNSEFYRAAGVAVSELKSEGYDIPVIPHIRDLSAPFYLQSLASNEYFHSEVKKAFSPERWEVFKSDILAFIELSPNPYQWQYMLADMGYNPPPTHALLGYLTTPMLSPPTLRTLQTMPLWDWLPMAVLLVVIWRIFGFWAAFGFLAVLCNTVLANYAWNVGSFFRQTWFWTLGLGICCLHRKYFFWAGILMGVSACMRVFPAIFLVGASIPLLLPLGLHWLKTGCLPRWADLKEFNLLLAGSLTSAAFLIGASLLVFPTEHWVDFFHRISLHGKTFFVMHMGYDKIAVAFWAQGNQNFHGAEGLLRMQDANVALNALFNQNYLFHRAVAFLGTLVAVLGLAQARPALAALVFGEVVLFFFTLPANYYYIYFSLLAAVGIYELYQSSTGSSIRFLALGLFTFCCHLAGLVSQDAIVQNGYLNLCLFLAVLLYLLSLLKPAHATLQTLKQCK